MELFPENLDPEALRYGTHCSGSHCFTCTSTCSKRIIVEIEQIAMDKITLWVRAGVVIWRLVEIKLLELYESGTALFRKTKRSAFDISGKLMHQLLASLQSLKTVLRVAGRLVVSIKFTSSCVAKCLIRGDVKCRLVGTAVRELPVDDKFKTLLGGKLLSLRLQHLLLTTSLPYIPCVAPPH